jgi:hypothetical protein
MQIVHRRGVIACALAVTLLPSLAFGAVKRFICRHQSGQSMPTVTITIDTAAKTIEITPTSGLEPVPNSFEISAMTFSWGFMRGSADLDRKTGKLAWDATSEYDYLDYIGQRPKDERETFTGRMQCRAVR